VGGEGPKEISMIYPNMTPANALKSGGMNEMQYYSAVKYDDSIANDNAKNNDARYHLNAVLGWVGAVQGLALVLVLMQCNLLLL